MTRDSFEVKLSDIQHDQLAHYLRTELQNALEAKSANDQEVSYWHLLYEQGRTRSSKPWPDAADLTSYLPAEKVDALHARIMRTIWTDPIWSAEGWGDAADKAPFVEEFHQWKAEEERLQGVLDKLALISLIEPRGLLEVSEGTEMRSARSKINAKILTDPMSGGILYDEQGKAQPFLGEDGKFVQAGPDDLGMMMDVDTREPVRAGPNYRIIPYADSAILPGDARDRQDVWGYAKRFTKRLGELKRQSEGKGALYDKAAIDKMSAVPDKEATIQLQRANQAITDTTGPTAQKELWEMTVLLDLNLLFEQWDVPELEKKTYDGERWYVVTLHLGTEQLLRIQHDDIERARYLPVILFPRPDRVTEGYSVVGHKLISVTEEHTAVRNMRADRSAMANSAPIKRLQGALWDPYEQPWGPKAVIDVRDMREVEPLVVPDVTAQLIEWETSCERTAERLVGVNDIASGQVLQEDKTLGEVQMATAAAEVRMSLISKRFNEFMEDLFQIRHVIWQRTLAERPEGMNAPPSMVAGLEGRGVSIDTFMPNKQITANLLAGSFRGKPRGSVDTSDPARQRQDMLGLLGMIGQLAQMFPQQMMPILMNPAAFRALLRQALRAFNWENTQAFLGSPSQDLQASQMGGLMPMLQQLMMGGQPGMPPQGPPAPMVPGPEGVQ